MKLIKVIGLLMFVFAMLTAADEQKIPSDKDEIDAETKKIELLISKIINLNDANTELLRETVNSNPEKYLVILLKLDGRFSMVINRLILKYIRGLEKYLLFKDFITEIGVIIDHDFMESQLVILQFKEDSKSGWMVQKQLANQEKIRFLNNNLEYNEYLTEDVDVKLIDFQSIAAEEAGKALSSKNSDTVDEAAVLAVWAYAGMCKGNYITAGLAIDACEKVLSRAFSPKNQTQPKDFNWSEQRKQQLLREIAKNKLEQIYNSVKFNESFEFRHKAVGKLNDAYSAKSELKTKISKLFEQFEKTKKFLEDTSTETERNKPINKLIRAIINITELFNKSILGGCDSPMSQKYPFDFDSQKIEGIEEIWDIYGDFLPEKHQQITELLDCQLLSGFVDSTNQNGFFTVADFIAHIYFTKLANWFFIFKDNYKTEQNLKVVNSFFEKMPKKRSDFYVALHNLHPELRSFAVNELAQTHYADAKKLLLKQANEETFDSSLIRQFAVFLERTDKNNFDEKFFLQVFSKDFDNIVVHAIAEKIWDKFQSTLGFERMSKDLQGYSKYDMPYLPRIKEQFNLLQAMSHKTVELEKNFHELIGKLIISKNNTVKYVILQMLSKHGVPDSFVEKVLAECSNDTILSQEPDKTTFPHMISSMAQLAMVKKYGMQESYREDASYFDRKVTFEFIKKFLGKDNEYDVLVKKYKVADEQVPADLSSTKKLIKNYLASADIKEREILHDKILAAPGSWDALRDSGRNKTDAEKQTLLQLADDISRKIKVIEHLSNDKAGEKFTTELNILKGKSLSYLELAKLAQDWTLKFNFEEMAVYAERLPDGKGLRLLIYTVKSDSEVDENVRFDNIVAAKYTRSNVSRLVDLSKFRLTRSKTPLMQKKILSIAMESTKYVTSSFEFYLHLRKY